MLGKGLPFGYQAAEEVVEIMETMALISIIFFGLMAAAAWWVRMDHKRTYEQEYNLLKQQEIDDWLKEKEARRHGPS